MKKLASALLILSIFSCKDDDPAPVKAATLQIHISYEIDGEALVRDIGSYSHPAGYTYSLSTLQYFISGLKLQGNEGSISSKLIHYVDLDKAGSQLLIFDNLAAGDYNSISFLIGLDSSQNISGLLDSSADAQKMAWPALMGGGYHFMKMEGYYNDSAGKHGYAMHLGRNENLSAITIPCLLNLKNGQSTVLKLKMNLNEWFRNPALFDFNTDGNYIMTSAASMKKLSVNGQDVFKVD